MDLNTEKIELIKRITSLYDVELLQKLKAVFDSKEQELWERLSPEEQEDILHGMQIENRGDEIDF